MSQTPELDPNAALRRLHRHLQDCERSLRNLHTFEENLEFLLRRYEAVLEPADRSEILAQDPESAGRRINFYRVVDDSLQLLLGRARRYRRWATIQRNRTQNQINLLFHLATQFENRINTRIADVTAKVAQQMLRDTSSMITFVVLTMSFLPEPLSL
ncbi:hypothetical protein BKA64DRAFT_643712 [Cadophora sp. MPI-SDFR-AT-0126]|nr:hypothetical protein BKA64DRAFT_643712 [Leotiomycetes sp. MPI-SDFR-AT-0126]